MRLLLGDNSFISVYEITEITEQIGWNKNLNSEIDAPSDFYVSMTTVYSDIHKHIEPKDEWPFEIGGRYLLDGTKESYEKAFKNYKKVCHKLLEQGWCTEDDFENFEWF